MDININAFSALNIIKANNKKNKTAYNSTASPSFGKSISPNVVKNTTFALASAAILNFASCKNEAKKNIEVKEISTEDVITPKVIKNYDDYIGPKDTINVGETIKDDGTKIVMEPDTILNSEDINMTVYNPDGTKTLRDDYSKDGLCNYNEITYYPEGNIKEVKSITTNATETLSETSVNPEEIFEFPELIVVIDKTEEKLYKYYNESGNLLYWLDTYNADNGVVEVQDDLGRVIERQSKEKTIYEYQDNTNKLLKSTSVLENCEHIRIYDEDEKIIEDYFIAKDGTKTPASVLDDIVW